MTEEQIEENAKKYAQDKQNMLQAYLGYLAGAHSRSPQEMFDELDPYQKANFMKNNIAWARTCDLRDELKLRHEL